MSYKSMRGLGLVLLFCYSAMASAASVSVAGFAFAGDFKSAAERFPYTYKIFKRQQAQGAKAGFSFLVNERMQPIRNKEFEFHPADKLVNLKNSDQALMTVLMLTGETVSTEYFGSYYKTFVNLRGDALIFDYKSQTIVRSYPVSVVLFDATPEQPSEERITGFVDDLIRREDARGLVTQFARRLEAATLPKDGTKTVQVRKSVVAPEALALMPEPLRKNPAAVEAMLSDSFASILSAKVGISMLPSAIGHAVGGVMSMRLENGDDFKLKLGEGDYLFELKLTNMVKKKFSENNIGTSYVYGAYANVHFFEPALNTDYLNSDFKNGETAVVPIDQIGTDDFSAYQDAIRGLFLKLADNLLQPSGKWLTSVASAKNIEAQVEASREILRKTK
jgi:hypothetical protein